VVLDLWQSYLQLDPEPSPAGDPDGEGAA